ncbi:MAG: hypothetical protein QOG64_2151, partial [Acidimicrobiaceae bacterium]|nr:hypothetical protein [Acidimicrobiaceae bacterium]
APGAHVRLVGLEGVHQPDLDGRIAGRAYRGISAHNSNPAMTANATATRT